ncbi:ABC transporter ATP-binding protein [Kordiimonas sp. SCSIO 12610]|uniref:ABC transporter transmembrane domain-containing protein n=1 Tax=Kordiimonas sp. SCSIO 12610 TaxID=2829597 RepID=UPI00210F15AE|nr:ABC transporter ATP-binding protein [Kordiimonas sp. SCSIO 12610]UTW55703.1 ABC transporter ATP-binding protein [Kordiimonas sp. SCSIO 12610]
MAEKTAQNQPETSLSDLYRFIRTILNGETGYYWLAIIYGIGISLLTLAVPISVQMLINTVANTGLTTPLIVLSVTLFVLLLFSGLLNALRLHLMELFGRRFYARMLSEISLRTLYAQNPFFADSGKSTLFNRYFDIVIVQKSVPYLLVGGFTVILQALVGFVIVSLYHPVFLGFNITLVLLLWLVWGLWGKGAMMSAVQLSHTKHNVAGWIEGLGASNGYYKSRRHIERALRETDKKTSEYIESSKQHFKYTFAQSIAYLFIYALASALLLGLGGWLVIIGELSLGQLVAAELILSAVFYGISQLGVYYTSFYDLTAAAEELSHFYHVPQEVPAGTLEPREGSHDLIFENARGCARNVPVTLNLQIDAGDKVMCHAPNHGTQRMFTNLLKHHAKPDGGLVSFAGTDVLDIEVHELRQLVTILDRPTVIEGTIREFLKASHDDSNASAILSALRLTGLDMVVKYLPEGLDTELSATGAPLSLVEVLKLKLTAAVLSKPSILVLNQLFDMMPAATLQNVIETLNAEENMTIIYFSNRENTLGFERFMLLETEHQALLTDFKAFKAGAGKVAGTTDTEGK